MLSLVVVLAAMAGCGDRTASRDGAPGPGGRPNIVVIMTDDQTVESLRVMERTRTLLTEEGTTFTNGISSFPLCCPARANFLTGQYAHNNGVRDNIPPDGGYPALRHEETLPVWLQRAGYATSHVGKYLNSYTRQSTPAVPPGWDDWFSLMDPSQTRYFDYEVNDNGRYVRRGSADADYQTDVLADRAVREIRRLADADEPFFLDFWPLAPHTGAGPGALPFSAAPAPRHLGRFDDEPRPHSPAIDESDISDKPAFVGRIRQLTTLGVAQFNLENDTDLTLEALTAKAYRRYLESLQAVDEAVGRIVVTLEQAHVLDDTVIFFFSDNGWSFGEHGISFAKTLPYENVLRVPFIVRGGAFAAGATVEEQVAVIDLPSTILGLAGATPAIPIDGRALPTGPPGAGEPPERALLLESPPRGSGQIPHYIGVRTPRFTYVRYDTDDVELYDRRDDPYETENLADAPALADTRDLLAGLVEDLRHCVGTGCQVPAPPGT